MPIEPPDLLALANEIKDKFSGEPAYRVAASRAYYACFHYSQELADTLDSQGGNGIHEAHIKKFTHSVNNKVKSIGYRLRQLHGQRVIADYRLDDEFDIQSMNEAIMLAERLIEDIDKIS